MNNISNKKWISLTVGIKQKDDINFLYKNFHHDILGTFENDNQLIFYFDSKIQNRIDSFSKDNFIIDQIKYNNWHKEYEKYFQPIKINSQLLVVPEWYQIKDQSIEHIKIKPGMAFGTGTHETTQLILSQFDKYLNPDINVLDLGSGSGILAIGAIKYGVSFVTCVEYDRDCEENFFYNMKLNNISDRYKILFDNVLLLKDFDYDCILANINKSVIIDLLPNIRKFRTNKSKIILSGLLINDKNEVMSLINKLKFNLIDYMEKGEWICLVID